MQFIKHSEIQEGDVIVWAYDRSVTCGASLVYYEVDTVDHQDQYHTIVYGKSYGSGGERYKNLDRKWDLVPTDNRDILLISRKS